MYLLVCEYNNNGIITNTKSCNSRKVLIGVVILDSGKVWPVLQKKDLVTGDFFCSSYPSFELTFYQMEMELTWQK